MVTCIWGRPCACLPSSKAASRSTSRYVTGADRDELGVHQLFYRDQQSSLARRATPSPSGPAAKSFTTAMGRMLTIREGPNNRQGWDGLRGSVRLGDWRVEAFYALRVKDGL